MIGVSNLKPFGILITVSNQFLIFFGVGLIIPNSLSHALKPYHMTTETAGSIFGGCYYCLIAGFTWVMSWIHNGAALPLLLFIAMLGLILACGSQMIRLSQYVVKKITFRDCWMKGVQLPVCRIFPLLRIHV